MQNVGNKEAQVGEGNTGIWWARVTDCSAYIEGQKFVYKGINEERDTEWLPGVKQDEITPYRLYFGISLYRW